MKNIKFKKFLLLFVISVIVISSLSVVCFADASGYFVPGDVYTFDEVLYPINMGADGFDFTCNVNGVIRHFTEIYCDVTGYETCQLRYYDIDSGDEVIVYDGLVWLNQDYRTITFVDEYRPIDQDVQFFFAVNGNRGITSSLAIGDKLFTIVRNVIYGERPLYYDEEIGLSLVSQICSLLVVLAPFLITGFIFIFILKRV